MNMARADSEDPGGESARCSSVGLFAARTARTAATSTSGLGRTLARRSPLGLGGRGIRLDDGRLALDVGLRRKQVIRLEHGTLGAGRGLALDNVSAAGSGDVHQFRALEFFDKIGEARSAVSALIERWIELQHGRFQKAELRLHGAPFEN